MLKIESNFALLDVLKGRKKLYKHFQARPPVGECPPALRIPVVITGYIDGVWGDDDGIGREFIVTVRNVEVVNDVR